MDAGAAMRKVRRGIAQPSLVRDALRPARLRYTAFRFRMGVPEMQDGRREYRSYEHYVAHQRSKLALLDLASYDVRFRKALAERLRTLRPSWSGRPVLCLAARIGTEVKAFHDVGAFAVGIDLNPGPDNRFVLPGDFHDLQFANDSVEAVYCNSLDHALDLDRVIDEAARVLRPGGVALIEAVLGTQEGTGEFGQWEARSWERVQEIADAFVARGFVLDGSLDFEMPWNGRLFVLRLAGSPGGEGLPGGEGPPAAASTT